MLKDKELLSGNEAIGEAAIRAGCRFFFGYPITPQGELFEYMARRLPEVNGIFLQSESEIAGINMVYGAASAGKRVMTASSGPGISLMQEGMSYLAATELPCVVVNIMRAGPGLGRIKPSQGDYFQATKGGGHGDYHNVVLAPSSVQEMADLTTDAFTLSDKHRNPVVILADGMLGQMMEAVTLPDHVPLTKLPSKPWAVSGERDRTPNMILAAPFTDDELISLNLKLKEKYSVIESREQRWIDLFLDDAELVVVAFGSTARIALDAISRARKEGMKIGLIRPVTLWPFPTKAFRSEKKIASDFLVIEMNNGQMIEDVLLTLNDKQTAHHFGTDGGWIPTVDEIYNEIVRICKRRKSR